MSRKKPKTPLFVTFEGGEGAGKSTLIQRIKEHLVKNGYSVVVTREPGGSKLGDRVRDILLNPELGITISPKAELLLYLAARAQNVEEVIRPSLAEGKIVLCDRFNDSSLAYQGYARGIDIVAVQEIAAFSADNLKPDLTFFLDIDPQIGLKRVLNTSKENAKVGQLDRIETMQLEFHKKVRKGFLAIAKNEPHRLKVIDAHQMPDKVFEDAVQHLVECLHGK